MTVSVRNLRKITWRIRAKTKTQYLIANLVRVRRWKMLKNVRAIGVNGIRSCQPTWTSSTMNFNNRTKKMALLTKLTLTRL